MDLTIKIVDWVFFLTIIASFVVSIRRRGNKDLRPIQVYIVVMLIEDILLEVLRHTSSCKRQFKIYQYCLEYLLAIRNINYILFSE